MPVPRPVPVIEADEEEKKLDEEIGEEMAVAVPFALIVVF